MSKVMEGLIVERLTKHLEETNGLSDEQYGFRRARSTIDAVRRVVGIAREAKKREWKKQGFCALVTLDIRNAFNTARHCDIIRAMQEKRLPEYLISIIEDYLKDRTISYEELEYEVTAGVP